MSFEFLKSERFWKLFLVGLVAGGHAVYPDEKWVLFLSIAVGVWFGGSVAVRTVDRFSETITNGKK